MSYKLNQHKPRWVTTTVAVFAVGFIHCVLFYKTAYSASYKSERIIEVNQAMPLAIHDITLMVENQSFAMPISTVDNHVEPEEGSEDHNLDNEHEEEAEKTPEKALEKEIPSEVSAEKIIEPVVVDDFSLKEIITTTENTNVKPVIQQEKSAELKKVTPKPTPKSVPKATPKPPVKVKPKAVSAIKNNVHTPSQAVQVPATKRLLADNDQFIISKPKPAYPRGARRRGIQGTVYVVIEVNEQGTTINARVNRSSGDPSLDESAVKAAYKVRLKPYIVNGSAQLNSVIIPYQFVIKG